MTLLTLAGGIAAAPSTPMSYWLFANSEGDLWCGYTDRDRAKRDADAASLVVESAMVTYQDGRLTQLTYQVAAESGDWILIDELKSTADDLRVRRTTLKAQGSFKFIKEGVIHSGKASPLRLVSATTFDGQPLDSAGLDVDYPDYPVHAPGELPFMAIVADMRAHPSAYLCRKVAKVKN